MGERLHEYDVSLTDYAIGNIVQYLRDRRFSRWAFRQITTPALIEYLRVQSDENIDAQQDRSTFSDVEMEEYASAFEDGPPGGPWEWVPYEPLHRRYLQTVLEVREGLSPQVAEGWSVDCVAYSRRLDVEGLSLHAGLEIVREWLRRLRQLQLAMCAERFVPLGDSPSRPLLPTTVAEAEPADIDLPATILRAATGTILTPAVAEPPDIDPRYQGLSQPDQDDIEAMLEAIRKRENGATVKPAVLRKEAGIKNQRARQALRWLEQHGEYHGFKRPPSSRRSRSAPD